MTSAGRELREIWRRIYDNPKNPDGTERPNQLLGTYRVVQVISEDFYAESFIGVDSKGCFWLVTGTEVSGIGGGTRYFVEELVFIQAELTRRVEEEKQKNQLIGVAKILDCLWENSMNSMGKAGSDRIRQEMEYYFGKGWVKDMYDFILEDGESKSSCHPVSVPTFQAIRVSSKGGVKFTCTECKKEFEVDHLSEEDRDVAMCTPCWRKMFNRHHPGYFVDQPTDTEGKG